MDNKQRIESKKIGERIREIRTQKQMSQADVAEKANLSLSQLSDIENGKCAMRLSSFVGIVEALQVSADVLLRPDTPEVNKLYRSEFAEVLADCTPSEIDSILTIVKEVKRSLQAAKLRNEY